MLSSSPLHCISGLSERRTISMLAASRSLLDSPRASQANLSSETAMLGRPFHKRPAKDSRSVSSIEETEDRSNGVSNRWESQMSITYFSSQSMEVAPEASLAELQCTKQSRIGSMYLGSLFRKRIMTLRPRTLNRM